MALFVNREKELDFIGDAVQALLDHHRLLHTPIIEVYGVGGMGKTALLKQVEQYCENNNLLCISIDMGQASVNLEDDLITQVREHLPDQSAIVGQSAVSVTHVLLEKGPVVMLFDAMDSARPEHLNVLQLLLHELIDNGNLFVILASKKSLPFLQKERSIARKLTPLSLQSLSREDCEHFLASINAQFETEVRNLIFEWTRGYPLAMNIMVEAIKSGLDPRSEQGRAEILAQLKNRVIYQEILRDIEPQKHAYYYSTLQLFSLPRRFSLVIMQDLIEAFLPELRRDGVLAYLSLPKDICETTDVMHWNATRAGYTVDAPVRTLFLLLLKQEEPERYFAIHAFLAKKNLELAQEVPAPDRVRYLREYLYHLANSEAPSEESLLEVVEMAGREAPDIFARFAEGFAQDYELKEVLGQQFPVVETAIHLYQKKLHSDREGKE
jgi:hypothetical protein